MNDDCTLCDPEDWVYASLKGEKCPICQMPVAEKFIFKHEKWFCSESCLNAFETNLKHQNN